MIKAGYGQSTEQNTKTAFAEAARAAIESFEAEELEIVFLFGSGVHATRIESGIQAAVEASGCENSSSIGPGVCLQFGFIWPSRGS